MINSSLMIRDLFCRFIKHDFLVCSSEQTVRLRAGIKIIHKNYAVDFTLVFRNCNAFAGGDVPDVVSEALVDIGIDVATGDNYFWY